MTKAQKKTFAYSSRYMRSMLTNCEKYLLHAQRSSLVLAEDYTGLKAYGSQALLRVFNKHRAEFEAAAREDTKSLPDEDNAKPPLPVMCRGGVSDTFSALYRANDVAKLPFHLDICNESDLRDYMSKMIRMDIVEQGGRPVSRIPWGKENECPTFWPNDIAPWRYCRSAGRSQDYDFGMPFVEVLREAARRALTAKGLDWREHYDKDCDKGVEFRRMKYRGMNLKENIIENSNIKTEV